MILDYKPQPRQQLLHSVNCRQIFYGGAAGGGKFNVRNGVVLTPFGYKQCQDLKVGDRVNAPDGTTSRIIQIHPWVRLSGVRVKFHDGTETTVAWDHLWLAWRSGKRHKQPDGESIFGEGAAEVVETREIAQWLKTAQDQQKRGIRPNWPCIPVCKPQVFNVTRRHKIELDPYQLGYWLGDGHISGGQVGITTVDHENFAEEFGLEDTTLHENKQYGFIGTRRKHWLAMLQRAGLSESKSDTKFIPDEFLWGSIDVRWSMLQGLLDTDGTVDDRGQVYFCSTSPKLVDGIVHLVQSLGGTATRFGKEPYYYDDDGQRIKGKPAEIVYIKLPDERMAFRLDRKRVRCTEEGNLYRRIIEIEETDEVEGRCITVSHPSGLYLTNDFIVTHNSWAVLNEAIAFCLANPGLQAYLFRRVLPELESNHLRYLRSLPKEYGTYHETRRQFIFAVKDKRGQPSVLHAGYAEQEKDIWDYRGREMHAVYVDEASQWTELQLAVLRAWNRIGGWEPDPRYKHVFPRCVFASNPGGPGHNFLKQTFIDPAPAGTVFHDAEMRNPKDPDDKGWTTIFIRSTMADNEYLDTNYEASFGGLPPEMRKAYTEGDWDVVPGAALELLSRDKHMVRNFVPPRHWTHFMSLDWGTAAPFSVGWYCVSDGAFLAAKEGWPKIFLPQGAVIRYREWYGWDGKPNHGCRWDSGRVARKIREIEAEHEDPPMDFRVADSQMWAQTDGRTIADSFMENGVILSQWKKDRKIGYSEIRSRLAGSPQYMQDGEEGDSPMLFATAGCKHFWRTLPVLTLDETDPDKGPADHQEDHVYDEVVGALRRNPYVTTEHDRYKEELSRHRMNQKVMDPYATG